MTEVLENIDRQLTLAVNGSSSLFVDGLAVTATSTVTWLPAACILLYVIIHNNEMKNIGILLLSIGLCILLADQGASGICKPLVARWRPANDPQLMYVVDVVNDYRGGRFGFFSSHAANTFAVSIFVSLLIREYRLTLALFSWALLNCWTRVYLGVHYVGDITVGLLYGILVGGLVYWCCTHFLPASRLHATNRNDLLTVTGYYVSDVSILIITLLVTYLYICFRALVF